MKGKESHKKTISDMDLLINSYRDSIEDLKKDLVIVSFSSIRIIRDEIKRNRKRINDCNEIKTKAETKLITFS